MMCERGGTVPKRSPAFVANRSRGSATDLLASNPVCEDSSTWWDECSPLVRVGSRVAELGKRSTDPDPEVFSSDHVFTAEML